MYEEKDGDDEWGIAEGPAKYDGKVLTIDFGRKRPFLVPESLIQAIKPIADSPSGTPEEMFEEAEYYFVLELDRTQTIPANAEGSITTAYAGPLVRPRSRGYNRCG